MVRTYYKFNFCSESLDLGSEKSEMREGVTGVTLTSSSGFATPNLGLQQKRGV